MRGSPESRSKPTLDLAERTKWVIALSQLPSSPPVEIVVAVLAAGVIHAAWNAIAKNFTDQRDSFALFNLGVVATCACALPFVGFPDPRTYGYLAAAMVVHQLYELVLMAAYRNGDFSQSYPIARGAAPLLVSLGGLVFAGEHLGGKAIAGLFVIVSGIALLAKRPSSKAAGMIPVWWAVATGCVIALYTVIDGLGVRAGDSALRYAVTLFFLQSLSWSVAVTIRRGWSWLPAWPIAVRGAAGGVLSLVGYFVVLWAQTRAAMGTVSALRETGVLWAALIGVVVFREGSFRRLVPPAALVVLGVALLSVG